MRMPLYWLTSYCVKFHGAGTAVDPLDPPRFESEATYLKLHSLLRPGEAKRRRSRRPLQMQRALVWPH